MKSIFQFLVILLFLAACSNSKESRKNQESTIKIGMQEWAPTNLDAVVFRNGDTIPQAQTDEAWRRAALEGKPAWCYYDNDAKNGSENGKLYNWYAVTDPRNICPEGWYIPTSDGWDDLVNTLGTNPGHKLKSAESWKAEGNGSDSIGFRALPAGIRYHSGMFDDRGANAYFWTASEKEKSWFGNAAAAGVCLSYANDQVGNNEVLGFRKGSGMSVRCVRRVAYDGYKLIPSNIPNDGLVLVDHEVAGRSGHVGNAVVECQNGDILAFYMNSSGKIWGGHGAAGWTEYKRSTDGGKTWSEPVVFAYSKKVWDENENIIEDYAFNDFYTAYVTSVITAPNGNLIAFVSQRLPILPKDKQRKPVYLISSDNGNTWGEPRLVDNKASFEDVTILHSDRGAFVYQGCIYAVFIGGGSSDYNEGDYSFYMSEDNGETFKKLSDGLFSGTSSGKHVSANVLEDGRFVVYSFNPQDEHHLPYVISGDGGRSWSEVNYTYMEKRMRNAQVSDKIGEYYFLVGRSGNSGDDPSCLVLYVSKNGIDWDAGRFLNKVQIGLDAYTAIEEIGKYDPDVPKRLLIQSSIGYSGLSTNVVHWWVENDLNSAHTAFAQTNEGLIAHLAKPELIADTFQFTEGPASDRAGNLYFTDIQTSRIYVWSIDQNLATFRDPSGRANGLRFDAVGNLLACEGASRRVTATSPEGEVSVLADRYNGKKLNSPNDLWVDPRGGIYFTDPRYSDASWIWVEKGKTIDPQTQSLYQEEQDSRALYYLSPQGELRQVAEGFMNLNGVIGTLDGKKLYVSDTEKRAVYQFNICGDGSLSDRKVFVSLYSDGMTLDELNNLYITNGGIDVFSPEGKLITTIELPYKSSNVCFGGKAHKTLFITARQAVFGLQMNVSGQ